MFPLKDLRFQVENAPSISSAGKPTSAGEHGKMRYGDLCCAYIDLPVTMPTDIRDCGFLLSKVKLYCFQGSIQLRVVKMASVLGCSSNAVLAEIGAQKTYKKGSGYRAGTGSSIFSLECRYHRVRPDYECFLQYTVSSGLRIFH